MYLDAILHVVGERQTISGSRDTFEWSQFFRISLIFIIVRNIIII